VYLSTGYDYASFADSAHLSFIRDTWQSVVAPHQTLYIALLIAFEATVGVLVVTGGRRTQAALVAMMGMHVALLGFGWMITVWSLVMLAALALLFRAETRALARPTTPPQGVARELVHRNGRIYERLAARRQHRAACDLYHSALELHLDGTTYAVEMGPVWNVPDPDRGAVCEGPVGARWFGRFQAFRYEVRCWPGGYIPDLAEAIDSPQRLTDEARRVAELLGMLRRAPPLTWGRDELGTGDMWNSNSLVAWALARTGQDMRLVTPPANGRAPGWQAGLILASRQLRQPVTLTC
jgi:hypothetical protein